MAFSTYDQKSRHAVGVFQEITSLQLSLQRLIQSGVRRKALCLAAQRNSIEDLGHYGGVGGPGDDLLGLMRDIIEFASGNGRSQIRLSRSGLADCMGGWPPHGGSLSGQWLERWLIPRHARMLENHLAAGRYLLWVRIYNAEDEKRVCTILLTHSQFSIHVHDFAAF